MLYGACAYGSTTYGGFFQVTNIVYDKKSRELLKNANKLLLTLVNKNKLNSQSSYSKKITQNDSNLLSLKNNSLRRLLASNINRCITLENKNRQLYTKNTDLKHSLCTNSKNLLTRNQNKDLISRNKK